VLEEVEILFDLYTKRQQDQITSNIKTNRAKREKKEQSKKTNKRKENPPNNQRKLTDMFKKA